MKAEMATPRRILASANPGMTPPKPERPERRKATFSLEPQLHKRLKLAAVEDDREMSDLLAEALAAYLEKRDHKRS